jgi:hypothetical protein
MLERLLLPADHAIAILMKDHDTVKGLFDRFEKSKSAAGKEKIIKEAIQELEIHAVVEEEIFYPAVRRKIGPDIMNEADEEHHVARVLIAELDAGSRRDDHRMAKFAVLAESVRHHIKEEEGEMLPKSKSVDIDFQALGKRILARKRELQKHGVPVDAEHAMIKAAGRANDTPAATARRKPSTSVRKPRTTATKKRPAVAKASS